MSKQKRVLIFSEDSDQVRSISKILKKIYVDFTHETDVYQATKAYKNRPFDLLICDLDIPDEKADDLIVWVTDKFPLRKIILIGEDDEDEYEELEDYLEEKSVMGFLQKPIDKGQLQSKLDSIESQAGLAGRVQRMNVLDLLGALRLSQPQRFVVFKEASINKEAHIYIQNTNIVHCEVYAMDPATREMQLELSGIDAFNKVVQFRNGKFEEKNWKDPPEISIPLPFDSLAMNASTMMDEGLHAIDPFAAAAAGDSDDIRTILLIDSDPMSRIVIQKDLFAEGFDCVAFKSTMEGQAMIEERPVDLVITDSFAQMGGKGKLDFLFWMQENAPKCHKIFLAPNTLRKTDDEDNQEVPQLGAIKVISKPVNLKRLKELIYDFAASGFKGYLNEIGVFDFIQLTLSAMDKKKLHIRDKSTGIDAKVYIDQSRFVHAEYGEMEGEEAFYKIVAIQNGDFMEDPQYSPPSKETLGDIMPHKLMIRAAQFLPQPDPVPVAAPPPAPAPEPEAVGTVTSLFGDDDDDDDEYSF